MKIAVDSNQFPATERLDAWRGILCDTFVGFDCTFGDDEFRAIIEGHRVGDHGITRVTTSGHHVDRSPTLIKRDGHEVLFFGILLAGSAAIIQDGREAVLEPGVVAFNDSTRPFRTYLGDGSDMIWLGVPKAPLADRVGGLDDQAAVAFAPFRPVHRVALDMMAGLDDASTGGLPPHEANRLFVRMLDLLALTIAIAAPGAEQEGRAAKRAPLH